MGEMSVHGIEFDESPVREFKPTKKPHSGLLVIILIVIGLLCAAGLSTWIKDPNAQAPKDPSLAPGSHSAGTVSAVRDPQPPTVDYGGPGSWPTPAMPHPTSTQQRVFLTVNNDPTWKQVLDHPVASAEALGGMAKQSDWYSPIGMRVGPDTWMAEAPDVCTIPAGAHFALIGTLHADNTEYTAVEYLGQFYQDPSRVVSGIQSPGSTECAPGTAVSLSSSIQMLEPKR